MIIRGQVESLRVIREGWGTLQILSGSARERTTVTGHPLGIDIGDTVEVTGEWQTHARFGRQLRATAITVSARRERTSAHCSYDRTACGFVTPNCPPFGLDLSTCGPLLDAARTCSDVQAALLLCRRCP